LVNVPQSRDDGCGVAPVTPGTAVSADFSGASDYNAGMRPIPLGAKGTFKLRVTPAHLANQFKDAMLPQVFATPMMILAMENAALNAIRGYLDPGESAVGTAVDIRHVAATPVGHEVTAQAEVTAVDGRRIAFNVSARDETEEIGNGTHARMVVDVHRLHQRLAGKSRS
jgi:fluoroacetyl-CoA thioesterase